MLGLRGGKILTLGLGVAVSLWLSSGCGRSWAKVEIDGSSTVYPISEAVASEFTLERPGVRIKVGVSGTGGGFKRFTKGEADILDASRPIKDSEFQQCAENQVEFIELPVAYDGLTIVVNKDNDFMEQITVDQLRTIFLADPKGFGAAKNWKDVDESWPDQPIKVFAPGTDSGTFDYFKEVMKGAMRDDMSTNENDDVLVTGVAQDKNAIGLFGASYYFNNLDKLKALAVVNPDTGEPVAPTPQTVENGDYKPFSRPLFIYVSVASLMRPEVQQFVEFYLDHAAEKAQEVDYVALPEELYKAAKTHYEKRLVGAHYLSAEGKKRSGSLSEVYVEANLRNVK